MADTPRVPVHLRRHGFDLASELGKLRADRPVVRLTLPSGARPWLVTRYKLVREVLADNERFGNNDTFLTHPLGHGAVATTLAAAMRNGDLTTYDPPEHDRLRRLIASGFTAQRIQVLQPRIVSIVSSALDRMAMSGPPADLVKSFALPVPSMVICELLGVPYGDREWFQQRAVTRLDSAQRPLARATAITESVEYMRKLVIAQRAEPDDGIIGMLIRDHGDKIDDRELAGIGDLLLLGGHETTANMLALGTLLLLRHPDHVTLTRDERNMTSLIEELLRYLSIVQTGIPRVVRTDTTVGGQRFRRGDRVLCSLPSANHDQELVADADQFDPLRPRSSHLAFGHGIHYCIGAPLARLEMRLAFPALLKRFAGLHVTVPIEQIPFRASSAIYGASTLPVAW